MDGEPDDRWKINSMRMLGHKSSKISKNHWENIFNFLKNFKKKNIFLFIKIELLSAVVDVVHFYEFFIINIDQSAFREFLQDILPILDIQCSLLSALQSKEKISIVNNFYANLFCFQSEQFQNSKTWKIFTVKAHKEETSFCMHVLRL